MHSLSPAKLRSQALLGFDSRFRRFHIHQDRAFPWSSIDDYFMNLT
jgi:L-arabinose isomerase